MGRNPHFAGGEIPSSATGRPGLRHTQRFAGTGPTSSRTAAQLDRLAERPRAGPVEAGSDLEVFLQRQVTEPRSAAPGANGANRPFGRCGVRPGRDECALVPMV